MEGTCLGLSQIMHGFESHEMTSKSSGVYVAFMPLAHSMGLPG
jgi:hypothetical protein